MSFAHAGQVAVTGLQPNAVYSVYETGTLTPATLFDDADMDNELSPSVATSSAGACSFFAAPAGYDLQIVSTPEPGQQATVTVVVPVNPLDTIGAIVQVLDLIYAGSDPFPVPIFGQPDGYDGTDTASIGAQLIVGTGGIPSDTLLDQNSDPIPDGWTFTAVIFVEGGVIYDIIAINAWVGGGGGIIAWGSEGGAPVPVAMPGGVVVPSVVPTGEGNLSINANGDGEVQIGIAGDKVIMANLPTSDPGEVGQLYTLAGVINVSAG